ncbi:EAL domain-containing protein [Lichenihabitans sp. PAMC28606]|uniref:putative bifunctional diguanylate cyclase/phosphodiesterase n=1 Tax=Lichenihabitans sp. PAMC28606 TaxID=2880932 RepID=UPI001D09F01C|nr:EAL domain-containing protein [Lichenihabitans sp. PAMC28606]UDL95965.1 EAL domain-containing protein [Lichenihabitans sp. PAMC28606]
MLKRLTGWEWSFAVTTALMALVAIYTSVLTSERQQSLIDSARYNTVFDVTQTASEFLQFEAAVGRFALTPSDAAKDAVQLRLAIVQNRLSILKQGGVPLLAARRADLRSPIESLASAIALTVPLVDALDEQNATRVLDLLSPLNQPIVGLIGTANQISVESVDRRRLDLARVYWAGLVLIIILICCGIMLIVLLVRRNRNVHHLAHTDHLTGLPNRLMFGEILSEMTSQSEGVARSVLMLLDIDLFKDINDALGHAGGDALLQVLARRLTAILPEAVLVARLGGDEFAILLRIDNPSVDSAPIAERVREVCTQPFAYDGKLIPISLSIGIVAATIDQHDPEMLMKYADLALYAAKASGRATYRLFDPCFERDLLTRKALEVDLRLALKLNQFDLHFQPIIDLATQQIVNCEALLRWSHPVLGAVPPSQFIPIAEEIGLITDLGRWVLARACLAARTWPATVKVSINLSPRQFDGIDLVAHVGSALAASELPASRVELEITESILLRDNEHVLRILAELKNLGLRIALDDFGTGYSSLGYLQRFPIDKIKIDQSFVRDLTTNPEACLIVESIGALANKLGLTTTAEGIETEAHAVLIRAMGYVEGQGYYFDRPLDGETCHARLWAQANAIHAIGAPVL